MTDVAQVPVSRFGLDPADISGAVVQNVGQPTPYRYTARHLLWLELNDAAGASYPANSSLYRVPPTIRALGVVNGTFGVVGQFGTGLALASGYFHVPLSLSTAYTLHFGFNPTTVNAGKNTLVSGLSFFGSTGLEVSFDGTSGNLTVEHAGASVSVPAGVTAPGFRRLTVVWDGASVSVYDDGVIVGSPAALATAPVPFLAAVVGASVSAVNPLVVADFLDGTLDTVHAWTAALTAEEVSALADFESGTDLDGAIAGSPGATTSPPASSRFPNAGLAFTGADSVSGVTLNPGALGEGWSLGVQWQHNDDASARVVGSAGVGVNAGVALVKNADDTYSALVGDGSTRQELAEPTVRSDAEVMAAVITYDAATQRLTLALVGSASGRQAVTSTLVTPPTFDASRRLRAASDGVGDNYLGAVYDVSWWPYVLLDEGGVATYTRGFVARPATTVFTRVVEPLGNDDLGEPPPGEADPPFLANLVPDSGATGVAVDAAVTGDIVDTGDGVDGASIVVTVDGTVAYDAGMGGLQNSFAGTVVDNLDGSFSFNLTAPGAFTDVAAVDVRVQASDLSPLVNVLDTTYSFTTADASPPFVTNQTPAPGATAVAQNSNVALRVTDLASPVVLSTVSITVDEGSGAVPAVLAGVVQSPYDGGASSVAAVGNGFDFVLDPTGLLAESRTITVSVSATDSAGNILSGSIYTFSTGDQQAPSITPFAPTAGAAGVTPLSTIAFDVTDLGTGVDVTTLNVTVDLGSGPVSAVVNGAFVVPFAGPGSVFTSILNGQRVTVDPESRLPDTQLIVVAVGVSDLSGNPASLSYSFTTGTAGTLTVPIVIENKGGGPVSVRGTVPTGSYVVTVTGTSLPSAPEVFNGRPGTDGRTVVVVDAGGGETDATADVYLPPLPVGAGYTLTFTPVGGGAAVTTPPSVTVVQESFDSRTTFLRRLLPPWMRAGIRRILDNVFPQG